MKRTLLALLISVALVVPALAASGGGAKNVETVGGFAVKLSAALGKAPATPEVAAASLRRAGVNLTADLGAKLTHDTATRILADLGVKVANSATPENEMTVALSSQLALTLSRSNALVGSAGKPPGPGPGELPTSCLVAQDKGQCNDCCIAATGCGDIREDVNGETLPGAQPPFPCNHCSKFCNGFDPQPPSDEAPMP
jgi:hypothetical protein